MYVATGNDEHIQTEQRVQFCDRNERGERVRSTTGTVYHFGHNLDRTAAIVCRWRKQRQTYTGSTEDGRDGATGPTLMCL